MKFEFLRDRLSKIYILLKNSKLLLERLL